MSPSKEELRDNPLAAEILAEMAAYFATVKKMQVALVALKNFDQNPGEASMEKRERQRAELFSDAAERVWFFIIQREAMKLPYYEELFAEFEIPDNVRRRMGPKKR